LQTFFQNYCSQGGLNFGNKNLEIGNKKIEIINEKTSNDVKGSSKIKFLIKEAGVGAGAGGYDEFEKCLSPKGKSSEKTQALSSSSTGSQSLPSSISPMENLMNSFANVSKNLDMLLKECHRNLRINQELINKIIIETHQGKFFKNNILFR
jgi:hypothetical protein